jgi:hypothetical protein
VSKWFGTDTWLRGFGVWETKRLRITGAKARAMENLCGEKKNGDKTMENMDAQLGPIKLMG